uniref:DUF4283 domain-containing protein n=1 Tax=Tanacetum cinerariifolium TaxID=118510 RepID=A0A699GMZ9_TANCI|nr:hypothetical protein [Tanacetum cinerariifolium]
MERGFLSQKGSGVGRGVKEKQVSIRVKLVDRKKMNTDAGTSLFTESDGTLNDANPLKEVVSPSVIDEHVAMEVQSRLVAQTYSVKSHVVEETVAMECLVVNTLDVGLNPPLPTQEANSAGNVPAKPSYSTATGKPNGKKLNVHTLFTPGGNGIDVVVLVDSIRSISERFANTTYGFFLGKKVAYPVIANYVRNTLGKYRLVRSIFSSSTGLFSFQLSSIEGLDAMLEKARMARVPSSYARVMIELRADVELKDKIFVAMLKITREGHYTCNVRVEYEWKHPSCSSCKFFEHIHEEFPKNTCIGEKKTVKKPSQTSRGVSVGLKMGFKPQKEYRLVTKRSNASSSGNKKKCVEPTIEVSNSNPIDVLNSVDNDMEFGTNGGLLIWILDNNGNPLVPTGIVESDSEVEVVFNETSNLRISASDKDESDKGYGTNSLLEQWRDSYPDNDDYDPYDDDMYENHDLSEHLQSICNDLDITVRGRKKK